jgi:hypothetical protein
MQNGTGSLLSRFCFEKQHSRWAAHVVSVFSPQVGKENDLTQ